MSMTGWTRLPYAEARQQAEYDHAALDDGTVTAVWFSAGHFDGLGRIWFEELTNGQFHVQLENISELHSTPDAASSRLEALVR